MLDFYKNVYAQHANSLIKEDWKHMNKNQLVNKYIEVENDKPLAEAYMSAIIYRYWGALSKYQHLSYKSVPDTTVYHDWLVQAIMRAIKARKWKDPTNKLFNDPAGPDKVINRCIISERLIYFQGSNTFKRRGNYKNKSLDKLQDELGEDPAVLSYNDISLDDGTVSINNLIYKTFDNNPALSFIIDGIINTDVFETEQINGSSYSAFSEKKLIKHLRNIDENYCKIFSTNNSIPLENVEKEAEKLKSLTRRRMLTTVKVNMQQLRKNYTQFKFDY